MASDSLKRFVDRFDQRHNKRLVPRNEVERRICRTCWEVVPRRELKPEITVCPRCGSVLDEVTT